VPEEEIEKYQDDLSGLIIKEHETEYKQENRTRDHNG
jgi:hypothetical protein